MERPALDALSHCVSCPSAFALQSSWTSPGSGVQVKAAWSRASSRTLEWREKHTTGAPVPRAHHATMRYRSIAFVAVWWWRVGGVRVGGEGALATKKEHRQRAGASAWRPRRSDGCSSSCIKMHPRSSMQFQQAKLEADIRGS